MTVNQVSDILGNSPAVKEEEVFENANDRERKVINGNSDQDEIAKLHEWSTVGTNEKKMNNEKTMNNEFEKSKTETVLEDIKQTSQSEFEQEIDSNSKVDHLLQNKENSSSLHQINFDMSHTSQKKKIELAPKNGSMNPQAGFTFTKSTISKHISKDTSTQVYPQNELEFVKAQLDKEKRDKEKVITENETLKTENETLKTENETLKTEKRKLEVQLAPKNGSMNPQAGFTITKSTTSKPLSYDPSKQVVQQSEENEKLRQLEKENEFEKREKTRISTAKSE